MVLRRVARSLLATIFISGGLDELLNPEPKVQAARPLLHKGQETLPTERIPEPSSLVQVDAAVKLGAGVMLAMGWAPRLAATALAAGLIPTTVAGHAFWEASDDERAAQKIHFFKNAGLLGGLLLAAADTEGKPSLGWRARRATREAERASKRARKSARRSVDDASSTVSGWVSKAGETLPSGADVGRLARVPVR